MKILRQILAIATIGLFLASCSSPAKMAEKAELLSAKCNPEVLEVVANKINAEVTVTFPEKFFHPKAIVEAVPVIVYEGGEVAGEPVMYQGEKVTENYKTIAKDGATVTERFSFDYVPGMEKSHLEIRMSVLHKDKKVPFIAPVKIADGANTTYMLVNKAAGLPLAPDGYQAVIDETAEAQLLYLISSATVRPSQLKSEEIKAFQETLKSIKADERREIINTEVVAYASPDGEEDFNATLSERRAKEAVKAFQKKINNKSVNVNPEVSYTSVGEDWEGFKELVENSQIEDKDLIIRVLEMYSDPMVREKEMRNMSQVFTVLAKEILPQLRRARFITNIEFTNYSDEELTALVNDNIDILDEAALLHAATLMDNNDTRISVYGKAIEKFNSDRARINSAITFIREGKLDKASEMLAKVADQTSYYYNTLGVLNIQKNDLAAAKEALGKSTLDETKANMAVIDVLEGKYADAYAKVKGTNTSNEALIAILNGNLDAAAKILKDCKCPCSAYLKAIVAARKGNVEEAKAFIEQASKIEKFAKRAQNDIEFAKIR